MAYLRHIYKSFQDKIVLDDVNLAINHGEVVALIGENGAGKTTLLEILRGNLNPDAGIIQVSRSVGYVPQNAVLVRTIEESFFATMPSWQINYALEQVGLGSQKFDTRIDTLSGGQRTRLALAVVLAENSAPDLLLLDEPTNNLDSEGLLWLEEYIRAFQGAVLLVSHDRRFINKTATGIAELHNGKINHYGGNYDFYRRQKAIDRAAEISRYEQNKLDRLALTKAIREQREKGKYTHEHMRKRPDHDTAQRDFFKNRVTSKFGQQARALEKRLGQLEEINKPDFVKDYEVVLGGEVPESKLILKLDTVCKSYAMPVLQKFDLEIRGKQRIHILGRNGSGKSTLLAIAAGRITADSGEIRYGTDVSVGYFSQDVDGLDYTKSGLENILQLGISATDVFREARSLGLTDQDLKKPITTLSRGQQAKLGFAKLLLASHDLLILDEPTNHLDIPTRERIENALQKYRGAILVASHDTYFVESLEVNRLIEMEDNDERS